MQVNIAARRIPAAPTVPVAALSSYEAWIATRPARGQGRQAFGASDYRRVATLRRTGLSFAEIGEALGGRNAGCVQEAYHRLPEALR